MNVIAAVFCLSVVCPLKIKMKKKAPGGVPHSPLSIAPSSGATITMPGLSEQIEVF